MPKAVPLFYVKGDVVFKRPVHRKVTGGTNITMGFPVCTASEFVSAKAIAAIFNENERPEVDAESPQDTEQRPEFCATADSICHHPACSCARWPEDDK